MNHYRLLKFSEQIKRDLYFLIKYSLKDPRIKKIILIHYVKISKDMKVAKIYWTVINENKINNIYSKILKLASGYLRYKLSKLLNVKRIPTLRFFYDKSIVNAYNFNKLFYESII